MTTQKEALKLALEVMRNQGNVSVDEWIATEKSIEEALAQPEPYDQTALELCNVCGWKTLIPDDACLNCERAQPEREPVAWHVDFGNEDEPNYACLEKPDEPIATVRPLVYGKLHDANKFGVEE
jgi:hypothetical protein